MGYIKVDIFNSDHFVCVLIPRKSCGNLMHTSHLRNQVDESCQQYNRIRICQSAFQQHVALLYFFIPQSSPFRLSSSCKRGKKTGADKGIALYSDRGNRTFGLNLNRGHRAEVICGLFGSQYYNSHAENISSSLSRPKRDLLTHPNKSSC